MWQAQRFHQPVDVLHAHSIDENIRRRVVADRHHDRRQISQRELRRTRSEPAQNVALGATTLTTTPEAGFVIEAALAFFLVIVVLTTAVARSAGNLAPIAIGMTVALNIMMAGSLTGANFNPAISLGPMIATANFTNAWLYVVAPIVGALVAALIHKAMKLLAEDGVEVAPRSTAPAE